MTVVLQKIEILFGQKLSGGSKCKDGRTKHEIVNLVQLIKDLMQNVFVVRGFDVSLQYGVHCCRQKSFRVFSLQHSIVESPQFHCLDQTWRGTEM